MYIIFKCEYYMYLECVHDRIPTLGSARPHQWRLNRQLSCAARGALARQQGAPLRWRRCKVQGASQKARPGVGRGV